MPSAGGEEGCEGSLPACHLGAAVARCFQTLEARFSLRLKKDAEAACHAATFFGVVRLPCR